MIKAAKSKTGFNRVVVSWVIVVLWAAFIFIMSAHEGRDLDSGSGLAGWLKHQLTLLAEAMFGQGTDAVSVAAHFLEYAVFGALLTIALVLTRLQRLKSCQMTQMQGNRQSHQIDRSKLIWLSALIAIMIASSYGVTDELHQAFVPGRMCDPADWLTDTFGASLGAIIAACIHYFDRPEALDQSA